MCTHHYNCEEGVAICKKCGHVQQCLTQHEVFDILDKPFFTTQGMHNARLGRDSLIQYSRGYGSKVDAE